MEIKDIKIKCNNCQPEKGTITFFLENDDNYLGISIQFKYLQKERHILTTLTNTSDLKITFVKNHMEHKDFINTIHVNSISEIWSIKKKDHFDINLGKDNKKFLNTMLYFILCRDNGIKFNLVKLSKAYNQYRRYLQTSFINILKHVNSNINSCIIDDSCDTKRKIRDIEIKFNDLLSHSIYTFIDDCTS